MSEQTDSILYIFAGTYQQAVDAARNLSKGQRWHYVSDSRHLLGIHGGSYKIVGTFWERRDAGEIHGRARVSGLSSVDA